MTNNNLADHVPFGKRAEEMAVYVILKEQLRVVVVSLTWLELERGRAGRSRTRRRSAAALAACSSTPRTASIVPLAARFSAR
jgi:hypothetical protein